MSQDAPDPALFQFDQRLAKNRIDKEDVVDPKRRDSACNEFGAGDRYFLGVRNGPVDFTSYCSRFSAGSRGGRAQSS